MARCGWQQEEVTLENLTIKEFWNLYMKNEVLIKLIA